MYKEWTLLYGLTRLTECVCVLLLKTPQLSRCVLVYNDDDDDDDDEQRCVDDRLRIDRLIAT